MHGWIMVHLGQMFGEMTSTYSCDELVVGFSKTA